MSAHLDNIRRISDAVADFDRPIESLGMEMMDYDLLLREVADQRAEFNKLKGINDPTRTETGHALDPWRASLSMTDRGRTAAFVRGGIRVVEDLLTTKPGPIHVLEAGCGPFAALSVPLMARFGPEAVQVTLVDIHQDSIDSVLALIGELGLSNCLREAVCGDLMTHEFSEDPDLIVLETMLAALAREPQVSLTRRLVEACPDALLIPETIKIDLQLIDFQAESQSLPMQPGRRKNLGEVFRLNRETARNLAPVNGRCAANAVVIPEVVESWENFFLTTEVTVANGVTISDYDAEITSPILLPASPVWLGKTIQFAYRCVDSPGFEWIIDSMGSEG